MRGYVTGSDILGIGSTEPTPGPGGYGKSDPGAKIFNKISNRMTALNLTADSFVVSFDIDKYQTSYISGRDVRMNYYLYNINTKERHYVSFYYNKIRKESLTTTYANIGNSSTQTVTTPGIGRRFPAEIYMHVTGGDF